MLLLLILIFNFLFCVIWILGSFIHILAYFKEFFDSFKEVVEMMRMIGSPATLPVKCKLFIFVDFSFYWFM